MPAAWMMTETSEHARASASVSSGAHTRSTFAGSDFPLLSGLTTATTCQPASRSRSQMCHPMKPVAPVTAARAVMSASREFLLIETIGLIAPAAQRRDTAIREVVVLEHPRQLRLPESAGGSREELHDQRCGKARSPPFGNAAEQQQSHLGDDALARKQPKKPERKQTAVRPFERLIQVRQGDATANHAAADFCGDDEIAVDDIAELRHELMDFRARRLDKSPIGTPRPAVHIDKPFNLGFESLHVHRTNDHI